MSALRSNWRHVVTAVLLAAMVSGWVSSARWKGVADAEAAAADRQEQAILVQAERVRAAELRSDHLADSLARARASEDRRLEELAAARAGEEAARDSLAELAAQQIDSAGVVAAAVHREIVAGLEREVARADSAAAVERAGRLRAEEHACPGCRVQIGELAAQVGDLQELVATKDRQIVALEGAAGAPRGISIDFGSDWWKVGAGFLLGWAATR
jgi:hypothetical protein